MRPVGSSVTVPGTEKYPPGLLVRVKSTVLEVMVLRNMGSLNTGVNDTI